jgi:putative protease
VAVEASTFSLGQRLLITGPTTGALWLTADEIHNNDGQPVATAEQHQRVSIPVPAKVRPNDKLFKIETAEQKKD